GVQGQADTGLVPVKVRFPNPALRLRTNAAVRVMVLTQPERKRLTLPEEALMEDQDQPAVVVVEEVKTEKNKEGEEQTLGKARKLRAITGTRDRQRRRVEILGLVDPEKKEEVSLQGTLFVVEGGNGLHDGDAVKVENAHKEER